MPRTDYVGAPSPMPDLPDEASFAAEERQALYRLVESAWQAFDKAADLPSRVTPAAPILFFGDLGAYRNSPLRVVTVGLNPSLKEFPADDSFQRFPLDGSDGDRKPGRYLDSMSAYFHTAPYRSWFATFEPLLNGAGASYYTDNAASTALHTDICSPIATDPTWTGLGQADRAALEADGGPLWHNLLEALRPQVVFLSVAKRHLGRIGFAPISDWKTIHVVERTDSGVPRKHRYEVMARWYEIGGERSLCVFGQAAQRPFGSLSDTQKREAGAVAQEIYRDG